MRGESDVSVQGDFFLGEKRVKMSLSNEDSSLKSHKRNTKR
jgi:hypothetical protein